MADDCPTPATLRAFATGSLRKEENSAVEAHLTRCLGCAESLDAITRADLHAVVGQDCSAIGLNLANSAALQSVLREGSEIAATPCAPNRERIIEILDPPQAGGALGSFAGYDVLEIAGQGGMGVVFKGRDRTLDRIVAIKVVFPAGESNEKVTARFLEEARAVAAIEHEHIVTVYQAGMANDLPYLVMPFHAEGTLDNELARRGKLAPREAARVGLQLANALAATHARGILHRDIKPSNVLLEHGLERLRLADFGLAQLGATKSREEKSFETTETTTPFASRVVAGTPHYMSPEQARGERIDARTDLFALGALLFQAVTGQTLYTGKTSAEVLRAAAQGNIRRVREVAPEVPGALAAVIDRMLAKSREDRFASAAEVALELDRFVSPGSRTRTWIRRSVAGATAVCLVACLAILALDLSGRTAIVNALLCRATGDGYFIRGRLGTYAPLADAVKSSRAGEVIEARFSGERVAGEFRLGGKAVIIRAAKGFKPSLYATNNTHPFILADGPLTLEGLTMVRRSKGVAFTGLIEAQGAPVVLLNCRLIRGLPQTGGDMLIKAGRLIPFEDANQPSPPLIVLTAGSVCSMRNCVVAGVHGTAVSLLGGNPAPARIEIENSLFAIQRGFLFRTQTGFRAQLQASGNVFVCQVLMELGNADATENVTTKWADCVLNMSQGAFVRLNRFGAGEWLRAIKWKEANVIYADAADFLNDRTGRRVVSETEWNKLMDLNINNHAITRNLALAGIRARSSYQLNGSDVDAAGLTRLLGLKLKFEQDVIGEGDAYDKFRQRPEYQRWQENARATFKEWEQRHTAH